MKKFYCFFIMSLLFISTSFSQVTWVQQTSGTLENLRGIYIVNSNVHYAVGNNGIVLKTTNAGQNWLMMPFPTNTNNICVYFQNENTGFVGNQNANIYKTINGGYNWEVNGSASTYAITSLSMPSTSVGFCGDHYSHIQKSTDNGQTWWSVATTPGYDAKIFFMNDNRGWAVDTYGYVYTTSNAGVNWSSIRISTDTLSSVYFLTSTIGYVAGDSGRVFRTTNGGVNWTLLNTGTVNKLNSIYVQNLNTIYACGNAGTIVYSNNGGSNWSVTTQGTYNLNNLYFIPTSQIGGIAGDIGRIYRTFNMGNTCIGTSNTPAGYPFYTYYMDSRTDMLYLASEILGSGVAPGYITKIGFYFTTADTLTMNGFNVKMQNTTASSLTGFTTTGWTTVYSGTYKPNGTGLRYINLPQPYFNWNGTSNLLIEICFNNSVYTQNSNVYSSPAVGMTYHNHTDLPTGDGCVNITTGALQPNRPNICITTQIYSGVNNNSGLIPDKYYLNQNYPNPFNPVTKIKYGLPKQGFVSLKIFDLLGREIKTIVNEQMNAGEFIVDFNGSELSSGTYFFRLEAGNFVETKKMILLK